MGSLLYIFFSHDARVFASNGKRSLQEGDKMIRMVHGGAMHAVLGITSHLDTAVLLDDPCSHFWWLDKVLFNYYPWSHGSTTSSYKRNTRAALVNNFSLLTWSSPSSFHRPPFPFSLKISPQVHCL